VTAEEGFDVAPKSAGPDEQQLEAREVQNLACARIAREVASKHPGLMIDSETVTRCASFGYVFRYEMIAEMEDDGPGRHRVRQILVLSTKDESGFLLASYPDGMLP